MQSFQRIFFPNLKAKFYLKVTFFWYQDLALRCKCAEWRTKSHAWVVFCGAPKASELPQNPHACSCGHGLSDHLWEEQIELPAFPRVMRKVLFWSFCAAGAFPCIPNTHLPPPRCSFPAQQIILPQPLNQYHFIPIPSPFLPTLRWLRCQGMGYLLVKSTIKFFS